MKIISSIFAALALTITMVPMSFSKDINPIVCQLLLSPLINKCQVTLLADLNGPSGLPGGTPYAKSARFTDLGNLTIFFADHRDIGMEPWVTDGTVAGTHLLIDIRPGANDSVSWVSWSGREIVRLNDKVFFLADDGVHGEELWSTNGTESGTKMVKNISDGGSDAWIRNLTVFQGKLYFMVGYPNPSGPGELINGLWVSEGTEATTKRLPVSDLRVDVWSGEEADSMVVLNNQLFFAGYSNDKGYELWQSDGTASGTTLLKDIAMGGDNCNPRQFAAVGDKVYFLADDGVHGTELWVTDGTESGTKMVKDIYPGHRSGAMAINIGRQSRKNPGLNGKLYFPAITENEGVGLWVTDGTELGTRLVKDSVPGPYVEHEEDFGMVSAFDRFKAAGVFNGEFYFAAPVDDYLSQGLWKVDVNNHVTLQYKLNTAFDNTEVAYLTPNNDYLFFRGTSDTTRQELFIMDKEGRMRQRDIYPGRTTSDPKFLHIRNDQSLLFVTNSSYNDYPGVGLYQVKCPVEE